MLSFHKENKHFQIQPMLSCELWGYNTYAESEIADFGILRFCTETQVTEYCNLLSLCWIPYFTMMSLSEAVPVTTSHWQSSVVTLSALHRQGRGPISVSSQIHGRLLVKPIMFLDDDTLNLRSKACLLLRLLFT